ncbi:neuroligin 4-like [Trichonephila inaurata madagascariensis]|uniref:Neuroligin 4-like n=1 Tax=Trichonephila inaurata madagascariensis TaxID=2747483 RepID=A0A8X6I7R8_9ARAC|nr:neuroligin 4-like [Trichonephila inaurata madagascariensis]
MRAVRFLYLLGVVYIAVTYGTARAEPAGPSSKMGIVGDHLNPAGKPRTKVISTKYGELRGFIATLPNRQLQPVEVYLGVPYASPPISALRFMPPVTPAHWKGTRNADRFGPVCPQKPPDITNETEALKTMTVGRLEYLKKLYPFLRNQSEDCLYLNIYAPLRSKSRIFFLKVILKLFSAFK